MLQEAQACRRGAAGAYAATDDEGRRPGCREPRLDDLLNDPIMALLWRSDRLEPAEARAEVEALRMLVRARTEMVPHLS